MTEKGTLSLRNHLRAGDIGQIIRLHGIFYSQEYDLDYTFEAYVASTLGEFAKSIGLRDKIWLAECDGEIVGSIAIVAASQNEAQLRWFLVDPALRGQGLGKRLINEAIQFAEANNFSSIFLWTISELKTAAHLYTLSGFKKTVEKPGNLWGRDIIEERYDLILTQ